MIFPAAILMSVGFLLILNYATFWFFFNGFVLLRRLMPRLRISFQIDHGFQHEQVLRCGNFDVVVMTADYFNRIA